MTHAEPLSYIGTADDDGRIVYELPPRVRAAQVAGRYKGKVVEVEIREFQDKRTERQNRALWALLNTWAREGGHNVNDLKDDVMGEVFGWSETKSPLSGRQMPNQPRSSKLSVQKFCFLIERILEIAAGCGVWLESPEEYRKVKELLMKKAARGHTEAA